MRPRHNRSYRNTNYDFDLPRSSHRQRQPAYPIHHDQYRDARAPVGVKTTPPRHHRDVGYYDDELPRRRHSTPKEDPGYGSSRAHRHQGSHQARARSPYRQERTHDGVHDGKKESPKGVSDSNHRLTRVATAAVVSGLTEAVRARHRPDQSSRAVKAAVGAAAMNALVGNDKNRRGGQGLTKSAVGGMLMNRLIRR